VRPTHAARVEEGGATCPSWGGVCTPHMSIVWWGACPSCGGRQEAAQLTLDSRKWLACFGCPHALAVSCKACSVAHSRGGVMHMPRSKGRNGAAWGLAFAQVMPVLGMCTVWVQSHARAAIRDALALPGAWILL